MRDDLRKWPLAGWKTELRLNNPITPEQWDLLTDVEFDHTDRIRFHTNNNKDVVFVKERKGRWKEWGGDVLTCSRCRHYWIQREDQYDFDFCPKCGADMREEQNDSI